MTQKGCFELDCTACQKAVSFSILDLETVELITCASCGQQYGFGQETMQRQLKKFAALCRQIRESEEILGTSNVAVSCGNNEVKVPFKLLLSRLKSTLDLNVDNKKMQLTFRLEPTNL